MRLDCPESRSACILPQKEKKEVSIPTEKEVMDLLEKTKGTRLYLLIAFSVFLY